MAENSALPSGYPGDRSVDIASETHRGLAAHEPARRHDQHAIVIGRAHLAVAVAADQRAFLFEHFETAVIAGKLEAAAGDRDRLGDLDHPLARMRVELVLAERRQI